MPNLLRSAKLATIPELDRVSLVGCVEPPEDTLFLAWKLSKPTTPTSVSLASFMVGVVN